MGPGALERDLRIARRVAVQLQPAFALGAVDRDPRDATAALVGAVAVAPVAFVVLQHGQQPVAEPAAALVERREAVAVEQVREQVLHAVGRLVGAAAAPPLVGVERIPVLRAQPFERGVAHRGVGRARPAHHRPSGRLEGAVLHGRPLAA